MAANWQKIALVGLKLPDFMVNNIEHNTTLFTPEDRCRMAFRKWLNGRGKEGGPVTWEMLVEALRDADHSELASKVDQVFTT